MNKIYSKFPTKIKIDNDIYDINSDFRNCLKIIMAYEDEDLTESEKNYILLKRLYLQMPTNKEKAIERGIYFLDCAKEYKSSTNELTKRVYSFNKDYSYIYSAMKQTHDVDLENIDYLHWWKFVFLFMDVNKDCTFSYLVSLRDKKNKGKLDKEEKKAWGQLREIVDLDYVREEEEEKNDFLRKYEEGSNADAQQITH